MITLEEALTTIAKECAKHELCKTCPMFTPDPFTPGGYCSITREGDVPAEWKIAEMTK